MQRLRDSNLYFAFWDHRARFLERDDLIERSPSRIISAKKLDTDDPELWLQGSDEAGPYCGCLNLSDTRRKPLSVAWLQRGDLETVRSIWMRRHQKQKAHNLCCGLSRPLPRITSHIEEMQPMRKSITDKGSD